MGGWKICTGNGGCPEMGAGFIMRDGKFLKPL